MKAIIVARVSTEEQREAGNSLPAQIHKMESYCKAKKLEIKETFSFDESAYKTKRDEFDKIIEYINNTKEKVAVCFDKVDRLSRNIFDKRVALLYEKAINNQIELHFVSDGQIINDKMNAGDKFAFGMKLGLSKYYSDAISDNVMRALDQKRRVGEWSGPVRLGYLNVSLDKEKRTRKDIILDPDRFHLIRKMFELYATDQYSLETIRMKMIGLGLRTHKGGEPTKSCIENLTKDSFYYGIAYSKKYNLSYPHIYPVIVSKELFDKCQEVRDKRGKKKNYYKAMSKDFIFKGLINCKNCGCTITPERKIKKSGKEYIYYSCTNSKKTCERVYVSEQELLSQIYSVLERFESIPESVQEKLVEELRKNTESEVVFHKTQLDRLRSDSDKLKIKNERLLEALLDQSITKDIYDKKHQEQQDEIQRLEIEMLAHTNADYEYQTTVATVFSLARRSKTIFDKSSEVAKKRAFLSYIIQNPVLNEKKLYFTIASPFNLILDFSESPFLLRE